MPDLLPADDPELCAHVRESMRSPFPLGWHWFLSRDCSECEREAHEAWVEQVRARLESAIHATANGWGWEWDKPGVHVRPDLPGDTVAAKHEDGSVTVSRGLR